MKIFLIIFSMFLATTLPVNAEQVLPDAIVKNTITISAPKTGELGKIIISVKMEISARLNKLLENIIIITIIM